MREITFDTETTGLDPETGDRIVEIGCVELVGKIRTGNHFHCYLNPEREVPLAAEKVHGLSTEFLSDKPLFEEVAEDFLAFISDARLVIHNAAFDMRFINFELTKAKHKPLHFDRVIDTLAIARKKYPGAKANLDALCGKFNIDTSAREKHGALLDAELLADVYIHMIGGSQKMLDLGQAKAGEKSTKRERKLPIPLREFPIPEEDSKNHHAFLEKITESAWG